ncbi:MAG: hypothetical protein ACI9YH_002755 [Colwellia sp.]|jgi:hypothetical protein
MDKSSDHVKDFPEEAPQQTNVEEGAKEKFTSDIIAMNADALALIAKTKKEDFEFVEKESKK